ncbi:MAG TPA: hypothetical protein VLK30_08460 [Candidatus Limnocylindrales bacterium]|nr:hypothetical protein [Candidatus Limnocylindrales bacterium]
MATADAPAPSETSPPALAPEVARRSRARRRLVAGVLTAFLVLAAGGLAAYANGSLSSRYSAGQAALDYFAAMKRGDAVGVMANATFLRGAGTDDVLFGKEAVTSMLLLKSNTDINHVSVVSSNSVDSTTANVKISMTWAGVDRTATYKVHRDPSQVHYLFYDSWRVDVPYATISVAMPPHSGAFTVDGVFGRSGDSAAPVQVIEGYHQVTMVGTPFVDRDSKIANAVDANPNVTFTGGISASAKAAVADIVHGWFTRCDASTHNWCPDHTYTAQDPGDVWYWSLAGYGNVYFTTYSYTIDPDVMSGVSIVLTDTNKAKANGTCKAILTVDGSRTYGFTGTWSTDLTADGSGISGSNGLWDCTKAAA